MIGDSSIWPFFGFVIVLGLGAAARLWAKSFIERSAQAIIERDLEGFKSELRQQEASLNSLQSSLLGGRAARLALLEKRHLDAIDAIWGEVIRLRGAGMAVTMMQFLKLPEVGAKAAKNAKVREFLNMTRGSLTLKEVSAPIVDVHQPFVGPVLWSKFSALRSVYLYAVATIDGLANGLEDVQNLLADTSKLNEMIKEVLPEQASYLDKNPKAGAFFLTQHLVDALLSAARDEIDGVQADADAVRHAHRIMVLAADLEKSRQRSNLEDG